VAKDDLHNGSGEGLEVDVDVDVGEGVGEGKGVSLHLPYCKLSLPTSRLTFLELALP
jgi:hypothetical protein